MFFKYVRTFLKKKKKKIIFSVGPSPPTKKHPGSGNFILGLVDPSRNRLVSTAYFAKPGFSILQYISISFDAYIKIKNNIFFFKNGRIIIIINRKFTGQIRNRLNRKKNKISDFDFLSYGHFCTQMSSIFDEFSR